MNNFRGGVDGIHSDGKFVRYDSLTKQQLAQLVKEVPTKIEDQMKKYGLATSPDLRAALETAKVGALDSDYGEKTMRSAIETIFTEYNKAVQDAFSKRHEKGKQEWHTPAQVSVDTDPKAVCTSSKGEVFFVKQFLTRALKAIHETPIGGAGKTLTLNIDEGTVGTIATAVNLIITNGMA